MRVDSIRSRILMFAMLATLLPSLATAWFSYLENKRALTAKATEELVNASTQAARDLDLWTKERRYDLRVFASSYEVTENLERMPRGKDAPQSGYAYERLTDYLNSVSERFADYSELLIVDPAGRVVASSGKQPRTVALPADWQVQMRADSLLLGTPYREAKDGRIEMLIGVPIADANGRSLGAITAKVNLGGLAASLTRFVPGESGQIVALMEDGTLIFGSRANSAATLQYRYPATALRSHLKPNARPAEYTDAHGIPVLGSLKPVSGLKWIVAAEIPSAEVFGQLARLRTVTLMIVAGMLALAGAIGYALGMF